jgi:small subunit ribosomal protein S5
MAEEPKTSKGIEAAAKGDKKPTTKEAPKKLEKKAQDAEPEDVEMEVKGEADIIPEVKAEIIVDEAEDEKELKEKVLKDIAKDKKLKGAFDYDEREVEWTPKTKLGKKVYDGEIQTMHEIMLQSAPIKEVGLVDRLLPGMQEEILDVGRVQRVTDSGRRMRFRVVAAVGNGDGFVGVGEAKGKEAGPTIRKSIERAKMNMKEIKRGCGSWECGCGTPHTVPFKITGKDGSVEVTLTPAPRGTGIVSGKLAKAVLALAGVRDVWVTTKGHTRTGINFAHAVVNALENTNYVKIKTGDAERLKIVTGQSKPPEQPMKEVTE